MIVFDVAAQNNVVDINEKETPFSVSFPVYQIGRDENSEAHLGFKPNPKRSRTVDPFDLLASRLKSATMRISFSLCAGALVAADTTQ